MVMIVDAQIHIWTPDTPERPWPRHGDEGKTATPQMTEPMSPGDILASMDNAGVDRAILVPPSWEGDRNDVALAAAAASPERLAVMGRIRPDVTPAEIEKWRDQPAMLGIRIILSTKAPWVEFGADHWLWQVAADTRLPVMIAPAGNLGLLSAIARRFRDLPIIIDHMGARVHSQGVEAFRDIEAMLALAALDNVSVKATSLPSYSRLGHPWPDVTPFLRQIYGEFGASRLFWGSDLSRLPCKYETLVSYFRDEIPWLPKADRDLIMGRALLDWIGWPTFKSVLSGGNLDQDLALLSKNDSFKIPPQSG
jgi:L-fuconolactonase